MIVPGSQLNVNPDMVQPQMPSQSNLLMAAAQMHQMGRLGATSPDDDSTTQPEVKPPSGHRPTHRTRRR